MPSGRLSIAGTGTTLGPELSLAPRKIAFAFAAALVKLSISILMVVFVKCSRL
jgi:hypothetical protein